MCQNNDLNIKKKKGENLDFENQSRKQCEKKIPITLIGQWNKNPKSNLPFLKKKINQLSK